MGTSFDILITTSTCPVSADDLQPRFVLDLAASLVPHFNRVHLLAPGAPGAAAREEMGGVLVHRFRYAWPVVFQQLCYRHGILQNIRANPILLALLPVFLASQRRAIRHLCATAPIRVLNSHWFVFQGLLAGNICRKMGVRHISHSHGADVHLLQQFGQGLGRSLGRYVCHRSDKVICESTYVRNQLDFLLGYPSQAEISCMGVDVRRFTRGQRLEGGNRPCSILFVGRLVEKKGVEYLIRAMPQVLAHNPAARLRIVGSGALESRLRGVTQGLGAAAARIEFLGALPHDQIAALMAETAVVALPSIIDSHGEADGMPTVLLEAMAAGRLVVASRVNGIPDVLKDGVNGWLCEPRDPADLATKIMEALDYGKTSIPDAARKTAEFYDWATLGARYATMLGV